MKKFSLTMFLAVLSLSWGQDLPILESENRAKLQSLCDDVSVQDNDDAITLSNIHHYHNTFRDVSFLLGCLSNSTAHTIEQVSLYYKVKYQYYDSCCASQGAFTQLTFDPIEANSTQPFRLGAPNEVIAFMIRDLEWEAENGETGTQSESGESVELEISSQIIEGFDEEYCDQAESKTNENGLPLVASKLAFYRYPIPFPSNPSTHSRIKADSGYIVGCLTNLSDYIFWW